MTTTIHAPTGDDDVMTIGGIRGVFSREITVGEISTADGSKVEITAPGVRIVLTPAAADKLRLWLDQWITDSAGEPPMVTTASRTSRRRSR
jgi:hypothetical protein